MLLTESTETHIFTTKQHYVQLQLCLLTAVIQHLVISLFKSGKLITIRGKNTGQSNGNSYMHFRNHTTADMVEQIF